MIFVRRVAGDSMSPRLRPGDVIIGVVSKKYRVGDIVIVNNGEREVIKRIKRIEPKGIWIVGDNSAHSTDSRHFGLISKSAILGVMKHSFPIKAVDPPKVRLVRAPLMGWIAAAIVAGFAVIHLFRIDTFVPELQAALAVERTAAAWIAATIVCAEVFALPFLMRMRLSPLAQYVSGALAIIVPLFWTLIAIWTYGIPVSTAQLGEFKALGSSLPLIAANLAWVIYTFVTIWALGYDHRANEKQSVIGRILTRLSKSA